MAGEEIDSPSAAILIGLGGLIYVLGTSVSALGLDVPFGDMGLGGIIFFCALLVVAVPHKGVDHLVAMLVTLGVITAIIAPLITAEEPLAAFGALQLWPRIGPTGAVGLGAS